jgi:hypothetical protein
MKEQNFVPREFDIFGGLDVDKKSIAVTFMSHQRKTPVLQHAVPSRISVELREQTLRREENSLCL